jgi:parallel beta-helix repeat protein
MQSSIGDTFSNGNAYNNSKLDVYASADSDNSTVANLMSTTSCGYTNAVWATCTHHVSPASVFIPVKGCTVIGGPGNYSLQNEIVTLSQSCITITSSNVEFNCNGHTITSSSAESYGHAISASNVDNVTINDCNISSFVYGVNVTNVEDLHITNTSTNKDNYGIILSNVSKAVLTSDNVKNVQDSGIYLLDVYNGTVTHNNVSYATAGVGAGLYINNSKFNIIENNTVQNTNYGIDLQAASQNNTVYNNVVTSSSQDDFICGSQDSGINAEYDGINSGATKVQCHWLVEVGPTATRLPCSSTYSAESFSLQSDAIYNSGNTCFSVFGNGFTLNCNGHTIISTSGGTLVSFQNSQDSEIENCFIKGFSEPIYASNSSVTILNNTVVMNASASKNGYAVVISGSNIKIEQNNITTGQNGLHVLNANQGSVENNKINSTQTSYEFDNASDLVIQDNTANSRSGTGAAFNNSTLNLVSNNQFTGTALGLDCTGTSSNPNSNSDNGGNICSSETSCVWIVSSDHTC